MCICRLILPYSISSAILVFQPQTTTNKGKLIVAFLYHSYCYTRYENLVNRENCIMQYSDENIFSVVCDQNRNYLSRRALFPFQKVHQLYYTVELLASLSVNRSHTLSISLGFTRFLYQSILIIKGQEYLLSVLAESILV
jgi:hypothetical protein